MLPPLCYHKVLAYSMLTHGSAVQCMSLWDEAATVSRELQK
jgi:hypothetical protein